MVRSLQPMAIALGLSLGLAVTHGLGLLALPLILPSMLADLGWDYWQGGIFASASAAGTVAGLVLLMPARRIVPPARLFQLGLLVTAAALIVTGSTRDLLQLATLRFVLGVASVPVLLSGTALASSIFVYEPDRSRKVIAVFEAGTCVGLVVGGAVLPLMLLNLGAKGWPELWLTLGLVTLASLPFAFWASRRVAVLNEVPNHAHWSLTRFVPALIAYAFGAAATLIVLTFLIEHARLRGANVFAVIAAWTTLGLAGILAPAFWQPLLTPLAAGKKIAAAIAMTAVGTVLLIFDGPPAVLVVASALLGFGAFKMPATILHLVQSTLPREDWPPTLAIFALIAAIGQALGLLAGGWAADHFGSLLASLGLAVTMQCLGCLAALLQSGPAGPGAAAHA